LKALADSTAGKEDVQKVRAEMKKVYDGLHVEFLDLRTHLGNAARFAFGRQTGGISANLRVRWYRGLASLSVLIHARVPHKHFYLNVHVFITNKIEFYVNCWLEICQRIRLLQAWIRGPPQAHLLAPGPIRSHLGEIITTLMFVAWQRTSKARNGFQHKWFAHMGWNVI